MSTYSHSQFETWRKCRRLWSWQRQYTSPGVGKDLWIGDVIHQVLAKHDTEGTDYLVALVDVARREAHRLDDPALVEECVELMRGMLEHYALWYPLQNPKVKVQKVEIPFTVNIPDTSDALTGRIDRVDKLGKDIYLREYKTANRIDANWLMMSEQASIYLWAAQQMGLNAKGVIFTVLAKRVPTVPQNRNGELWLAANAASSILTVRQWAKAQHLIIPTHIEQRLTAEGPGAGFIEQMIVTRNDTQLEQIEARIKMMCAEIPTAAIYPSFSPIHCGYCSFKDACVAQERGDDYQTILDSLFIKKGGDKSASQPTPQRGRRKANR